MADGLASSALIGGTRATDVLHRLRDDILACVFQPGQRLKFETLRDIYGVSFSTLREALSRLASEELVVAEGQRGFAVAAITREELLDLTHVRVVIERECLRLAMGHATDVSRQRILTAFHRMDRLEAAMQAGAMPPPEWDQRHFEFHEALVAAAGSPTLTTIRRGLFERARRYRRMSSLMRRQSAGQAKSPRHKRAEHRAILDATVTGDADHATDLMEQHIRETTDALLATMQESATPEPPKAVGAG